ncbi:MAG: imidazoleglycerol-phosphate dehydratase HisB [Nitrospirae bacterium]|nr:imidazoleglycerol-phosphate dehydratase HisB [Nitrospirota bacterium]MBF0534022.1 imidazoleglycerol-phosphate dehydratase HisB [Nitrospirota bacterium]MBF0616181.1 imidazoleglycerol-phosphate dehydratase HisB [Nitrospirota bacterium]
MRKGKVTRKTKETDVTVEIVLNGSGVTKINTQIPFLNHMLDLMGKHGLFDLTVEATGDIEVDYHHLMEDVGLTLGAAIAKALGTKEGITRFGSALVPMDESLSEVIIDLSGRPYMVYNVPGGDYTLRDLQVSLFEDFFRGVSNNGLFNLHVRLHYGRDTHHMIEAIFKAFGRALSEAVSTDPRVKGVPSTKGSL